MYVNKILLKLKIDIYYNKNEIISMFLKLFVIHYCTIFFIAFYCCAFHEPFMVFIKLDRCFYFYLYIFFFFNVIFNILDIEFN